LDKALDGIVIVERAGRLAASICGALLAELGATVIRVEAASDNPVCPALALPGKHRIRCPSESAPSREFWERLAAVADALVLPCDHGLQLDNADRLVTCTISAYGAQFSDATDTQDWVIQAEGGIMAVTGSVGGPPESTRFPVFEVFGAINAATSILAALRVARRDGIGQSIDISLFDAAFAMLGTHISAAVAGKPRGHRVGCKHPLCSPWDIYRSGDSAIQICVASESQWKRLTTAMNMPELATDRRFATSGARVEHAEEISAILQAWLTAQNPNTIADDLTNIGIPAAKVEQIEDVLSARAARDHLLHIDHHGRSWRRARSVLLLSKSPGVAPSFIEPLRSIDDVIKDLPPRQRSSNASAPCAPLDKICMVEIGPYTAGPLAGRYLSGLGAQVLKVEVPQGEDSRRFQPKFGELSGFFSNYNFGKTSIRLDLEQTDDRDKLLTLLRNADILLQNLKPGALDRLGIHVAEIVQTNPQLIACSISGYGAEGPPHAALDTVVQAQSGVMSLVGDGKTATKSGFSLADLIAAHLAPLAVLAALNYRDRTGLGQEIDISMLDCLVWALQPAWDEPDSEFARLQIVQATDGHAAVLPTVGLTSEIERMQNTKPAMNRAALVAHFEAHGARTAPILELDEVIRHPCAVTRENLTMRKIDDALLPILASPYRLKATPPVTGGPICEFAQSDTFRWLHDARC
jgi:crotonobetainyl-CoA:carnitine CoA-transferase CaiB-like acyl-CoA transferase